MSARDYRAGRVRMDPKIEELIYHLIVAENDTFKKKKHNASWYISQVKEALNLEDRNNPSLRTYQEKIREIRNKLQPKHPEDEPWCVVHCIKYGISGAVVPLLIRLKDNLGDILTIRMAQWISYLFPILDDTIKAHCPDDQHAYENRHALVAYIYSECARFSAVMGRDIDTSDFDTLFFKHGDVSEEAIATAMFDMPFATGEIAHPKVNSTTEDESFLNERLGELTAKDRLIVQGYIRSFARSRVAGRNFIYEHREEIEPIQERAKKYKTGGEE